MKFKNFLNERMILSLGVKGKGTVDIYTNPDTVDMRNAFNKEGVRFVLNYKEKVIYLWNSKYQYKDIVPTLMSHANDSQYREKFNDYNRGMALKFDGKKLSDVSLDKEIPDEEKSWLEEYLDFRS